MRPVLSFALLILIAFSISAALAQGDEFADANSGYIPSLQRVT